MTTSPELAPELPYLEAFRRVCAEGSFTAAARVLGCSQPAVSYQVKRLEETLGVTLLERTGRGLVLTPEGRRVRAFADDLVRDLARVRAECVGGRDRDPLRLGSASGFGRYVLVPALHRLRAERADGLEVQLQYEAADVVLDRLEEGEYEAAFVYKRRITSSLVFTPVYDEELVLIGSAELVKRSAGCLERIEAVEGLPFVTYEECDYVFGRWFETCFGSQPARLVSRSRFTELEEVIDFVGGGVGVSVVPRDSAQAAIHGGVVAILPAGSGERCLNPVYRATRSGSEVRPVVERLSELVRCGRET